MKFEQMMYNDSSVQMPLPLFQPLRLWTPRPAIVRDNSRAQKVRSSLSVSSSREFSMKGGYLTIAGGEKRLMIAGKIFKSEER
jgi:hypothetical protein